MKELIERLRAGSGGMSHWMELEREAADAIERLENEVNKLTAHLAACRDAVPDGYAEAELAWAVANPEGVAEYVKAAFVQMQNENTAYDIRMDNDAADLAAERLYSMQAMQAVEEIAAERDALRVDAARYRWLLANAENWSYQPGRYSSTVVSGFAAHGTGYYLGYTFEQGVDLAMEKI